MDCPHCGKPISKNPFDFSISTPEFKMDFGVVVREQEIKTDLIKAAQELLKDI
jgi:hypothetical protein